MGFLPNFCYTAKFMHQLFSHCRTEKQRFGFAVTWCHAKQQCALRWKTVWHCRRLILENGCTQTKRGKRVKNCLIALQMMLTALSFSCVDKQTKAMASLHTEGFQSGDIFERCLFFLHMCIEPQSRWIHNKPQKWEKHTQLVPKNHQTTCQHVTKFGRDKVSWITSS